MMTIGRRAFVLITLLSSIAIADEPAASAPAAPPPASPPAPAREKIEGAKLDALFADIAKARKETKTMKASFTQERKITLLATSVKSKGELLSQLPDRLRWDLAPPDDIVYFVNPEGLSYKTKSSSATVPASGANVARALGDLRALLTGDLSALKDRYVLEASRGPSADIEVNGTARPSPSLGGVPGPPPKPLDPKAPTASVRAFTLVVEKNLVTPIRARLIEGKSDSIDLTFSNVVLNAPIDPARLKP
jgi:outer membrane lipoprotein-sorting protein